MSRRDDCPNCDYEYDSLAIGHYLIHQIMDGPYPLTLGYHLNCLSVAKTDGCAVLNPCGLLFVSPLTFLPLVVYSGYQQVILLDPFRHVSSIGTPRRRKTPS